MIEYQHLRSLRTVTELDLHLEYGVLVSGGHLPQQLRLLRTSSLQRLALKPDHLPQLRHLVIEINQENVWGLDMRPCQGCLLALESLTIVCTTPQYMSSNDYERLAKLVRQFAVKKGKPALFPKVALLRLEISIGADDDNMATVPTLKGALKQVQNSRRSCEVLFEM